MPGTTARVAVSEEQAKAGRAVAVGDWNAAAGRASVSDCVGAAGGGSELTIASKLSINRKTVRLWRERFSDKVWPACGRLLRVAAESRLRTRPHQGSHRRHLTIQAEGKDSLELPTDGGDAGAQQVHDQYFVAKP